MKKLDDRFKTAKTVYSLLKRYNDDPNYSSSLLAEDLNKLLRELIRNLEKFRFNLVDGDYELSPSQEALYNKCHEMFSDNSLTHIEQLKESFKYFLEFLNKKEHDVNGYSLVEAINLHRLSCYELFQTERYMGSSEHIIIRGINSLKKKNAIGEEEAEKLMKNACLKQLVAKLNTLNYREDQIRDIIGEISSSGEARKILELLHRGQYVTSETLINFMKSKRVKQ